MQVLAGMLNTYSHVSNKSSWVHCWQGKRGKLTFLPLHQLQSPNFCKCRTIIHSQLLTSALQCGECECRVLSDVFCFVSVHTFSQTCLSVFVSQIFSHNLSFFNRYKSFLYMHNLEFLMEIYFTGWFTTTYFGIISEHHFTSSDSHWS